MGNRSTNQSPLSAALYLLEAGLIAAGVVLLEGLSAVAEIPVELAPRVMLSAGLSAGLVLALGVRALPGILAGAVAAGFLYYKGGVPAALVFTVAMLLQAQLIGLFAGRLGLGAYAEAPSGESGRGATSEVFDLVALAVLGACVLPTLQTAFDCASGAQPWASFSRLWWSDWIGSALGVMMLAPPVMHVVGHWRTGAGLGNALVPLSVAVLSLGPAGYLLHSAAELQRELAPTAGLRLQWVQDGISWLVLCAFIGLGLLLAWLARQQQRAMQVQQGAAEALRQSEARFRSLTALSSDFYWETDEDSRFTHHEARANLAQLGGDVMGRRRWELAGATAISASWELHQSVLNQRKPFRDFEWMSLGQDGKAYYNRVSGEPVFDALGRFTGYRGVATDISEIRDYKVPVWARGLSVVTTKRPFNNGEFCVPVSIGGVAVMPGDAILADENGVLVLKPDQIADAAPRAIEMQAAEGPRLKEVAAGARLPELNGTNARLAEILAAQAKGMKGGSSI